MSVYSEVASQAGPDLRAVSLKSSCCLFSPHVPSFLRALPLVVHFLDPSDFGLTRTGGTIKRSSLLVSQVGALRTDAWYGEWIEVEIQGTNSRARAEAWEQSEGSTVIGCICERKLFLATYIQHVLI